MIGLKIYDTAEKSKVDFKPLVDGKVSIYVCGLTVYDLPHIGHARTFVVFDVFRRFLKKVGYEVKFVRNHTDIDDKIIRRSCEEGTTPEELATRMIDALHEDMASIDVEQADIEPRVTQHIPDIIAFIQKLFDNGYAYQAGGDVYFRVSAFKDYGKLSHRNLDEMINGVRIEVNEAKEAAGDFALWKGELSEDKPAWDSPWGRGRPGWHIECSCMSTKYLSPSFDIHGGGRDLIFPHHENEIAQAKGAQEGDFARYWMHVGMVEINGEKMSHSLKNFWTVRDIRKQVHPEALRYFFLTTHYRNNINFSHDTIQEATLRITSLYRTLEAADRMCAPALAKDASLVADDGFVASQVDPFVEAMADDLNTPKALAVMAQTAKLANEIIDARGKKKPEQIRMLLGCRKALQIMGDHCGLFSRAPETALLELRENAVRRLNLDVAEIEKLLAERAQARQEKNWAVSDQIRDRLAEMGVQILDRPEGTTWQVS
ncbi:MAG: cysteine--tRNA ligase [Proteobacteria bacterium]|nr:cysteine--tRNA ligase [Pseudomonadota bacterium]